MGTRLRMMVRAFHGEPEWSRLVTLLLGKEGTRVNQAANDGAPLYMASQNGHAECVTLLGKEGIGGTRPRMVVPRTFLASQNGHASV